MSPTSAAVRTSNYTTLLAAGASLFAALGMVFFPLEVFSASTQGIWLWWEVVLPSILPFLIIAEIMIGLGILDFLGALLEPLMRPLFNLPGSAAFVVAMGFTSGFPVGAYLTGRLRSAGHCSRLEGERLLSFTNNASPLFMLAAVPIGMLGMPALGVYLAAVNYGVSLLIGILFRFYGSGQPSPVSWRGGTIGYGRGALQALLSGRRKDGRPLGRLMGDAVRTSVISISVIGGFIVFFSVLIRLLGVLGVWGGLVRFMQAALGGQVPAGVLEGVNTGIWEMTLGCQAVSASAAPTAIKIALVGFILGWAGLAIHAQVVSMIADTDLRYGPFILSRLLHGTLSAVILYLGFHLNLFDPMQPVAALAAPGPAVDWFTYLTWSLKLTGGTLAVLLLLALGCGALKAGRPTPAYHTRRPWSS
ncbi:MAG: sporulation integral membrane protein YlbJ [Firmicutes bacterium]|nr:sporulation integral membrane protein YlbJ [Bacillota bacterium]